jgi:hypothetical protein
MTPEPHVLPEQHEAPKGSLEEARQESHVANLLTLEICFLAVVGLVVVAAFFEALTYQLVSSRTPFVIMAPLFLLIVIHAKRLYSVRDRANLGERLGNALRGKVAHLNAVVAMGGWMTGLLALIVALGHYIGLLVFCFALMIKGDETRRLSATIAIVTTGLIFLVFEYGFDVELYRGLLFRYFAGYRDF